jgi:4-oxalocrotonate tautomerase
MCWAAAAPIHTLTESTHIMPTLSLRISPLLNPHHYSALGEQLTQLTAHVLHKRPEVTVVMMQDLPAARFCVAGAAATCTIACLEIDISAGTNTAPEKAQFVQQAHDLLGQLLGPLHEASYVIVRELPAHDWGYGGRTQLERQREKVRQTQALQAVHA